MLTITEESRLFGADSFIEQTKYPYSSFGTLQKYLGLDYTEDLAAKLRKEEYFINPIAADDRGQLGWIIKKKSKEGEDETQILYTEELLGMILKYGRKLSET
jgi:hypothetical protein